MKNEWWPDDRLKYKTHFSLYLSFSSIFPPNNQSKTDRKAMIVVGGILGKEKERKVGTGTRMNAHWSCLLYVLTNILLTGPAFILNSSRSFFYYINIYIIIWYYIHYILLFLFYTFHNVPHIINVLAVRRINICGTWKVKRKRFYFYSPVWAHFNKLISLRRRLKEMGPGE